MDDGGNNETTALSLIECLCGVVVSGDSVGGAEAAVVAEVVLDLLQSRFGCLGSGPEWAGNSRFIRVMPNTPSAVGEAASVMSLGGTATEEDGELIAKLFGSVGKIWKADEKLFDAITGLSGSGPAYIFLAIEALADGGVTAGLPRDLALELAS